MDDLFRLLVLRAAQRDSSLVTVQMPIGNSTPFQNQLANARQAAAPHPQQAMWAAAGAYVAGAAFIADVGSLPLGPGLKEFRAALTTLPDPSTLKAIQGAVTATLGRSAAQVVGSKAFADTRSTTEDTIIATMLAPQTDLRNLDDHLGVVRLLALLTRIANGDGGLALAGALGGALSAAVVLPSTIFPVDRTMIQPISVADDWIVRQHIARYELGEIALVENILQGESRNHSIRHSLTSQQTLTTLTDVTTETTKELQTTDRFDLKSEVESTLKEDTAVKGGVSVKYDSSPWTVTANVDASYQRSKSDSSKIATDQARDVVQRASTKVTQRVMQQQVTQTTEIFENNEDHLFNNSQGAHNVAGVYQWINKILRVQTFDLGPRMVFDITVPEPAALLWDLKRQPPSGPLPVKPVAFTADPTTLTMGIDPATGNPGTIGQYLSLYEVTGIPPAPDSHVTISAAHSGTKEEDRIKSEILTVPVGYKAVSAHVQSTFSFDPANHPSVRVEIGRKEFSFDKTTGGGGTYPLDDEEGTLAVAIDARHDVDDFAMSIDVQCDLTPEAFAAWQLQAHSVIMQAYVQRLKEYNDKVAEQALQAATSGSSIGVNPDLNRQIEQVELKRETIALIGGPTLDLLTFDGLTLDNPANPAVPQYPRPNPDQAQIEGRIARFFEEALEWENMNYFCYPYYWGRKEIWYQRVLAQDDDPLFANFLRAGEARVAVPVRPGFEPDILYFIRSGGQIWKGAPLPDVNDSDYLSIANEIRAAEHGTIGIAGEFWEVKLPTNQVYLRADAKLPVWQVDNQWNWTPAPAALPE